MSRAGGVRLALAAACVVGLALACFGPALSPARQFAYRDFSDFYYPLHQRIQQEWDAGRLPVWAAEENGGMPLLASPTAAVLYPGKLIFAALPYPWAAKVYVGGHVVLAFGAMLALLRGWRVSMVGSTLGAMAYAFGAPVVTQYANVVFLVGAAWMPLGFRFADGWVRLRRGRSLAALAVVLAMQVLGGDPEAAYLTGVAALGYEAGRALWGGPIGRRRRLVEAAGVAVMAYFGLLGLEVARLPPAGGAPARAATVARWRPSPSGAAAAAWAVAGLVVARRWWAGGKRAGGWEGGCLGLVGAGGIGLALAGAQVVPSLEFAGRSTRVGEASPVDIYPQSVHPARIVEAIWPDAFGAPFGRNRSWLNALPPSEDYNIWMTSLYLGGLTTVLAAVALASKAPIPGRAWLAAVALVGALGSLGYQGSPLFWARTVPGASATLGAIEEPEAGPFRPDGRLRDGDGGPYWFLASALPGFRTFRYPGKLMIPAVLAIAALAGLGFDALAWGRKARIALGLAWASLAASLAGLAASVIAEGPVLAALQGRVGPATSAFGPLDPALALGDLRRALLQGSLVLAAGLGLARLAPLRPALAGSIALAVMAVDLALVVPRHVGTTPQSTYDGEPTALAAIRAAEAKRPSAGPFRVHRLGSWAPLAFNLAGSPDRLEALTRWERNSLRSHYELPYRVASTFSFGTAELADHAPFFQPWTVAADPELARELGIAVGGPVAYYPRRGFDLWNARYFILPTRLKPSSFYRGFAAFLPQTTAIYPDPARFAGPGGEARLDRWAVDEDVQVFRNDAAMPRAWVVHQVRAVGPTAGLDLAARMRVMAEILYGNDAIWHVPGRPVIDHRRVAWVELAPEHLRDFGRAPSGTAPDPTETVQVVEEDDPTRVTLEVTLKTPGLVVLADVYYPGWELEIDGRAATILRVNRAMRGALVGAGPHRLVYRYRPTSIPLGFGLSGCGLAALGVLMSRGARGPATDKDERPKPGRHQRHRRAARPGR